MQSPEAPAFEHAFTVPDQQIAHPDVYSLQLFRTPSPQSAPILRLDSREKLTLRFDMMESRTRQFRVSLSHHNDNGSRSPLPPEEFMGRFTETFFGGGSPSTSQRPSYRRYEYQFPNEELQLTRSGNYLLHISDFENGELLFTLPFFVHENEGSIRSSTETIPLPRADLRTRQIPSSTYEYPEFVEMPRYDLKFYYTQNRFWGRMQQADELDVSSPGEVFYEVSREQAFTGDYELRGLSLQNITRPGGAVREYNPDAIPPLLVLREDVQGLTHSPGVPAGSRFGRPASDPGARYGDLHFRFQPRERPGAGQQIYLTGDFNSWLIQENLRMELNPETGFYETEIYLKEGFYNYKYVLLEDRTIRDLALDDSFQKTRQEFITFVYYRDPVLHYDRLLQVNRFHSN